MTGAPEWARYGMVLADFDRDLWNITKADGSVVVRRVPLKAADLFYRFIEEGATEQEAATMVRAAARAEQAIKQEEQR